MEQAETPVIRNALAESFAEIFQVALIKKFKRIPTAQFITVQFNAQCEPGRNITQESVRRWLNGITIPEFDRLIVVRDWLDIDLNGFAKSESENPAPVSPELFVVDPYLQKRREAQLVAKERFKTDIGNLIDDHYRSIGLL